jgi:hypothetical protein
MNAVPRIYMFVSREEELNDRGRMRTGRRQLRPADALCIMVVKMKEGEFCIFFFFSFSLNFIAI